MTKNKLTPPVVFIFLFFSIFLYRIAFKEDFLFKGILQIVLYSIFDVCTVILCSYILDRIWFRQLWPSKYIFIAFVKLILSITAFYLSIKLLKQIHYFTYTYTVGFSKEFKRLFELESYQIFDSYIVVAFGSAVIIAFRFYEKWNVEKIKKEQAEKAKITAELSFLKAQINPHFIFNTLNNIHFLIDKTNEVARNTIHDFSELLRYQLYETGNEKVSINKEIQYLENYMQLQKIRKEDGFLITFNQSNLKDFKIAPLLLIVPVENAFKYTGSSPGDYIIISMQIESGNIFSFKVVNSKSKKTEEKNISESGLGLNNLKKRVELIYGSRATLFLEDRNDHFEVLLTLNLKKDEDY